MLEYLFLFIGGYFGGHEHIIIYNQNGILKVDALYLSSRSPSDNKRKCIRRSVVMTRERSKRWLQKLEQIHFENWEEKYCNYDILDGTQWSLAFRFLGQEERKCVGSNAYPDNWESAISLLNKLTSKLLASSVSDDEATSIVEQAWSKVFEKSF